MVFVDNSTEWNTELVAPGEKWLSFSSGQLEKPQSWYGAGFGERHQILLLLRNVLFVDFFWGCCPSSKRTRMWNNVYLLHSRNFCSIPRIILLPLSYLPLFSILCFSLKQGFISVIEITSSFSSVSLLLRENWYEYKLSFDRKWKKLFFSLIESGARFSTGALL